MSASRIVEIKGRMSALTDFYLKHKIGIERLTIFPADYDYLATHCAEAYTHGFETVAKSIYFRGLELVPMRDAS